MTLKITNCSERDRLSASEEVEMSEHIAKTQSVHEGRFYVRLVKESFIIPGPFGEHLVIVFKPLREPLWLVGRHLATIGLQPSVLKPFLKLILQALDFLHSECHIIHTGKCTKEIIKDDRLTVKYKT